MPGVARTESARAWIHWPALSLGGFLFVLDAFVMGQGFVAAVILLGVGAWLLPKAWLLRLAGRSAWPTLRLAAILAVAAFGIMVTINANNAVARERARDLVAAIETYRAINGRFPSSLEALAPAYVASVPHARYALSFNRFIYRRHGGTASLAYVDVPPFGRVVYDFGTRRWRD